MEEIQDTKEYKKFVKIANEQQGREFLNKTNEELEDLIAKNTMHKAHVIEQTKANSQYQSACRVKSDFDKALKEKLNPTNISLALAVAVLKSRGAK